MTNKSIVSLIAATVLFGMGTFSIASAVDGRMAFDSEQGVTITQMNAATDGTGDRQEAMLAGQTLSPVLQASR